MTNSLIFLGLLLLPSSSFSNSSLLFSPREVAKVLEKRGLEEKNTANKKNNYLTCEGISYASETNWCVWINGQKFNQDNLTNKTKSITILSVGPNQVETKISLNQKTKTIILKPNKSFDFRAQKS